MAIDFARYDDLVHRIYDAALEPSHWPDALGGIADACGGARSAMFTPLHSPEQGGFGLAHNVPTLLAMPWGARWPIR